MEQWVKHAKFSFYIATFLPCCMYTTCHQETQISKPFYSVLRLQLLLLDIKTTPILPCLPALQLKDKATSLSPLFSPQIHAYVHTLPSSFSFCASVSSSSSFSTEKNIISIYSNFAGQINFNQSASQYHFMILNKNLHRSANNFCVHQINNTMVTATGAL